MEITLTAKIASFCRQSAMTLSVIWRKTAEWPLSSNAPPRP
jgi:hypothetical protein